MKNRFCRMGKTMIGAFLLLSIGGITYSCQDDYILDETRPSFLGGSIYDELKSRNKFNYTVRLIEDLGYKEVMSKTGSKTLFVAPDAAYEEFFKNNQWGVHSYEQLTDAQKRILFNGAQLNNAYVIEMMGNADNGDKNLALRQNSAAAVVDSVRWWRPEELPTNYSQVEGEKHYWDRFKGDKGKSILMATDDSEPMMTHFVENNMKEQRIKRSDVAFIVGDKEGWSESDPTRAYVFGNRVVEQDVVCLNGYFHVLDKVLVPPSSMAEEIRTNGSTNIFSHILDRFSAPYYDATLTENYKALHNNSVDSIFEKRYFAINTKSGRLITGPDRVVNNDFPLLTYDPGWNSYKPEGGTEKEKDMGVMFVPSDKALEDYFLRGAGKVLIERYGLKGVEVNEANLMKHIDQIPLDIVQPLVNNLMKPSFNESVPSKYLTIMNDARDPMFPLRDYPSEAAYKSVIDKTVLANNGVVYVMNRVVSPADYASVLAPALYSSNTQVVRTVVRADDSFVQGSDYAKAPLQQYFSTYLKAMQSRFSFFVPTDEGLKNYGYIDPASMVRNRQVYYRWEPTNTRGAGSGVKTLGIRQLAYRLNLKTGPQAKDPEERNYHHEGHVTIDQGPGYIKKKLLIEMVNHHIVVHGDKDADGLDGSRKYLLSREGAPIIVEHKGNETILMGGLAEQLQPLLQNQNENYRSKVIAVYDQTRKTNGYGNGMTYLIDRPLQATTRTAHYILRNNPNYSEFLKLCEGLTTNVLDKAGLYDSLKAKKLDDAAGKEREKIALKYYIFVAGNKAGQVFNAGSKDDKLVRFFNNYRYTIYAPTNEAVKAEVTKGLPTWETIEKYLTDNLQAEVKLADDKSNQKEVDAVNKHNSEIKIKAQAMITTLVNFLKYHFQDESVFVDGVSNSQKYSTSSVNNETKVYMKLDVTQTPNSIVLKDESGQTIPVVAPYNQLVRDANFDRESAPQYIRSSSYAVVHTIGKALLFDKSLSAGYARKWSSVKQAKAFLSKFSIKE
jgi:lipoprotein